MAGATGDGEQHQLKGKVMIQSLWRFEATFLICNPSSSLGGVVQSDCLALPSGCWGEVIFLVIFAFKRKNPWNAYWYILWQVLGPHQAPYEKLLNWTLYNLVLTSPIYVAIQLTYYFLPAASPRTGLRRRIVIDSQSM